MMDYSSHITADELSRLIDSLEGLARRDSESIEKYLNDRKNRINEFFYACTKGYINDYNIKLERFEKIRCLHFNPLMDREHRQTCQ